MTDTATTRTDYARCDICGALDWPDRPTEHRHRPPCPRSTERTTFHD